MRQALRQIGSAVLIALFVIIAFWTIQPIADAQTDPQDMQTLEQAHEDLLRDPNYTFTYGQREVVEIERRELPNFAWMAIIGKILTWLFIAATFLAILYLLFLIGRELISVRFAPKESKAAAKAAVVIPGYKPEEDIANILLAEVDKLAAQGRYEEAVHTLLLRSIQDIRKNKPRSVPPALTSREIGGLPILSTNAQTAFKTISALVETSFFGGYALDKSAFETSREAYKSFAFEQGGLAAGGGS